MTANDDTTRIIPSSISIQQNREQAIFIEEKLPPILRSLRFSAPTARFLMNCAHMEMPFFMAPDRDGGII